ncbi:Ig-like domain-containing protein [Streptomyces collinus]|uniref:Ig-like domain-containing protein n=1 Tax=Streptomyces collinus TaxID=42684 RepID=UPI00363DCE53
MTSAAASITLSYTPPGKPVRTRLFSIPNPSRVGQRVIFTDLVCPATATAVPTGTVTFRDATTGTPLGTAALHPAGLGTHCAVAVISTSRTAFQIPGDHTITATCSGETVYQGNSSHPETLTQKVYRGGAHA